MSVVPRPRMLVEPVEPVRTYFKLIHRFQLQISKQFYFHLYELYSIFQQRFWPTLIVWHITYFHPFVHYVFQQSDVADMAMQVWIVRHMKQIQTRKVKMCRIPYTCPPL